MFDSHAPGRNDAGNPGSHCTGGSGRLGHTFVYSSSGAIRTYHSRRYKFHASFWHLSADQLAGARCIPRREVLLYRPTWLRSCRERTHGDIVAVLNIPDMADRFCTAGPMDYRGRDLVSVKSGADAFLPRRDSSIMNTATVSRIKFCTISTESAAFQAAAGGSPNSHAASLAS
jgi:hypothetical protein